MKDFNLSELRYQILSVLNKNDFHPLTQKEIEIALSDYFELSEEDRKEKTPSGQPRFYKTVAAQEQLLKKAGLEKFEKNGHSITEKGKNVLSHKNGVIYYDDLTKNIYSETKATDYKSNEIHHYQQNSINGCTMLTIPRNLYQRSIDKDLLDENPCLYILSNSKRYYIGYSGNAFERIYVHSRPDKKPFPWTVAYVFIYTDSTDGSHLNMSDASFLEFLAFEHTNYNKTINLKKADRPYMKPKDKEQIEELFNTIKELLYQSGVYVFE